MKNLIKNFLYYKKINIKIILRNILYPIIIIQFPNSTFSKPKGKHEEKTRGHWFYTHHGDNGKKLVIHTRQLSFLFDYSLLEHITDEIKEHLRKLGLI